MRFLAVTAASAATWPMITAVGGPAGATPNCGVDLAAPAAVAAVKQLPHYPGTGWSWDSDPATFTGNADPCAALSVALVTVERATGSSPIAALMFHDGEYVGTATSHAYGYTSLNTVQTTDNTVVLDYRTPGTCSACPGCACPPDTITHVRYRWQDDRVVMLDPGPTL